MATARHRRRWASTARLWPRGSSSAARSTEREQISALGVADVSFRMQLSMEETTPASPSTGMGSSARSCARSRLPSSGAHGRSDCRPLRFRAGGSDSRGRCDFRRAGNYPVTGLPRGAAKPRVVGRPIASADGNRDWKTFTAIGRCPREQLPPLEQRGRVWSLPRAMLSGARHSGARSAARPRAGGRRRGG